MSEQFPGAALCANCSRTWAEHATANFVYGPFVGARIEICPTAIFRSRPGERHPLDRPAEPPQATQPATPSESK